MNARDALAAGAKTEYDDRHFTESYVAGSVYVEPWRWHNSLGYRYYGPGALNGVQPDPELTLEHCRALRERLAAQADDPSIVEGSSACVAARLGLDRMRRAKPHPDANAKPEPEAVQESLFG